LESRKILVIDDDEHILESIQDFLEEKGFNVLTAKDGLRGLELAEKEAPQLILLDVGLPEMSGYSVCKRIREIPALRHTPIIMLTAHSLDTDELSGFKAGADDYLTKPFKPARLLARIETAIDRNMRELDANSLTHLPGNKNIIDEIQNRIIQNGEFSVLYMDLNNFKGFNDRYGFVRGDEAIKLTSEILVECFGSHKLHRTFIGHVGGDDFVGIVDSNNVDEICKTIVRKFDEAIIQLYDEEDRKRGLISSMDRKGNKVDLPLMGLAIAVVTNEHKTFRHPGEIAFIAGDLKKWAKTRSQSSYVIDRRS
jgi:diguanylate cyclase (GGDEF)-like protein